MTDRSFALRVKRTKQRGLVSFLLSILVFASSNFAFAQVTASLSGKIQDSSGLGIPAATVIITNLETAATRTVSTDESGSYQALSLPVGPYQVRAEKPSFGTATRKGIDLVVGQAAVVNITLEVGNVEQQVTVTAEAALVDTSSTTSVAGLVGEKEVKDLPLNGRSFDNLIALNASSVNFTSLKSQGAVASALGNSFVVSGRRPSENLFLLNGVEYTGPNGAHALPGGASGQLLGIDAVREFNVVSDNYSAEYGKRAGAQVSIVTQSGANQLHGSIFEFLRNSALDARNFFDYPIGERIPPFRRNQFGGSLGGPIKKNKTFIFGNYEGFRQRLGLSIALFVPDNAARQGLLPNAQGVPTPVAGLNQAMLPYMAFWPVANGPDLGTGIAEAFSNSEQSIQEDFGTVRVDHTFSDKDVLNSAYTIDEGNRLSPWTDPLFGIYIFLRDQVLSTQETHIFSPTMINTFTAGLSRVAFLFTTPPLTSFSPSLSFVNGRIPGTFTVGGVQGTGDGTTPYYTDYKTLFTYADGLQLIKGRHQIKLGVWFQPLRSNTTGSASTSGSASFTSLTTFLQGTALSFSVVPNSNSHAWRQFEGAWFLQDSIRVRPNLSLSLGLRHEFTNGWNDAQGRAANIDYDSNGVLLTNLTVGTSVFSHNNAKFLFSPRIGLSWDPFNKGKTSVRAGFGTYYSLQDYLDYPLKDVAPSNGLNNTAFYQNVSLLSLLPVNPTTPLSPACGPGVVGSCTVYAPKGVDPNLHTQTVQEWTLSIEQEITPNTLARVAYIGTHGYYEIIPVNTNTIVPLVCSSPSGCTSGGINKATATVPNGAEYIPIAARPNPYLGAATIWASVSHSNYNAMILELTRRLAHGLQFKGNYTYGRNYNIGTGVGPSDAGNEPNQQMDPYNLQRDWGPSANDFRHQAGFSTSYELPSGSGKPWLSAVSGPSAKLINGWQLNGIMSVLSGPPFTPQVGSNQSGNGGGGDRPNWNPAFSGSVITGSPNQWFNPNAFVIPTSGTFGNVGRGVLRAPGFADLDLSLLKTVLVSDRIRLQFRAESFNLLNHPNFSFPNPSVFSGPTGQILSSAGAVTSTASTSRQIQFGLKLMF